MDPKIKNIQKYLNLLLPLGIGVALFVFLQFTGKYLFYYLEQQQLFLYNGRMACDLFMQVGGLSKLISYFLLQYFAYPYVGALVLTLFLMALGHAVYKIGRAHV